MSDLRPSHGVRVLFERRDVDTRGASYLVSLHAPDASWSLEVPLGAGVSSMREGAWHPDDAASPRPAPWMLDVADAFLRVLVKNHAAAGDWPRRWLRWRGEKSGAPH